MLSFMNQNIQITCINTKVFFSHVIKVLEVAIKNCCSIIRDSNFYYSVYQMAVGKGKRRNGKRHMPIESDPFIRLNYTFIGIPNQEKAQIYLLDWN